MIEETESRATWRIRGLSLGVRDRHNHIEHIAVRDLGYPLAANSGEHLLHRRRALGLC